MRLFHGLSGAADTVMLLSACGPPVIYDTEHNPVIRPLIVASVDNGWLAVDSTALGIRAVVELQMEGPTGASDYVMLHIPTLHCTVSGEHLPSRVLREDPVCPAPTARPIQCPDGAAPDECQRLRNEADLNCLYTIRAEFLFDRMPHLDENSHFFTFGQTDQAVRWAKSPGN
jgi:hypothetical protein